MSCDVIDLNPSHTELWPGSPTSFTADALPSADQNLAINFTWGLPRDGKSIKDSVNTVNAMYSMSQIHQYSLIKQKWIMYTVYLKFYSELIFTF